MNFNKIKNFVLIFLVIAAVYQTGTLWLGDSASYNVFYSLLTRFDNKDMVAINTEVIDAKDAVVGFGNKSYVTIYYKEDNKVIFDTVNKTISEIIKKGTSVGLIEMELEEILESRVVVYEFSFDVLLSEYIKGFGEKLPPNITEGVTFSKIVVVPAKTESEKSYLFFIGNDDRNIYCYEITKSKISPALYSAIETLSKEESPKVTYFSSKQNKLNTFVNNIFIPQIQEGVSYPAVKTRDVFGVDGVLNQDALERNIEAFFSNIYEKSVQGDGTQVFSDKNIVVKYYPIGVLEYYNYDDMKESKSEQSLSSAYFVCKNFIRNEKLITSDIYLSDVQRKPEGLVFYFDYSFNDLPVFIADDLKESLEITSAIEVVVDNGVVKKYKCLNLEFETIDVEKQAVDKDFLAALNEVIMKKMEEGKEIVIEDMQLVYYKSADSEILSARWYIIINGETYYTDAFKQEEQEYGLE